jgi:hypothetical protein
MKFMFEVFFLWGGGRPRSASVQNVVTGNYRDAAILAHGFPKSFSLSVNGRGGDALSPLSGARRAAMGVHAVVRV